MDLLFKRYASPYCYLDALLEYGEFARGVANILETDENEKMWELYLSNNPENTKSFKEWKKEVLQKTHNEQPLSKAQVAATVEKSQQILKGFKPPKA